jgi:hypothetical protein
MTQNCKAKVLKKQKVKHQFGPNFFLMHFETWVRSGYLLTTVCSNPLHKKSFTTNFQAAFSLIFFFNHISLLKHATMFLFRLSELQNITSDIFCELYALFYWPSKERRWPFYFSYFFFLCWGNFCMEWWCTRRWKSLLRVIGVADLAVPLPPQKEARVMVEHS